MTAAQHMGQRPLLPALTGHLCGFGEVSWASVSQTQSERVRLDGLLQLLQDSLWEKL